MDMLSFYKFLSSLSNEEIINNLDSIRCQISEHLDKSILQGDKSFNVFVVHIPSNYFLYISDHITNSGLDKSRVYSEGQPYFNTFFYPEELRLKYEKIEPQMFKLISEIPPQELVNWHFSYDFRMIYPDGSVKKNIMQFQIVINKDNQPFIAFAKVSDVTNYYFNNKITFIATHESENGPVKTIYEYFPETALNLSKRELEILKCIQNGMTSKTIADTLNISVNTVNNHRQNMLDKAGCENITQLLRKSKEDGLI